MENRSSQVTRRLTVRLTEEEDRYLRYCSRLFNETPSMLIRKLIRWELAHDKDYQLSDIV